MKWGSIESKRFFKIFSVSVLYAVLRTQKKTVYPRLVAANKFRFYSNQTFPLLVD